MDHQFRKPEGGRSVGSGTPPPRAHASPSRPSPSSIASSNFPRTFTSPPLAPFALAVAYVRCEASSSVSPRASRSNLRARRRASPSRVAARFASRRIARISSRAFAHLERRSRGRASRESSKHRVVRVCGSRARGSTAPRGNRTRARRRARNTKALKPSVHRARHTRARRRARATTRMARRRERTRRRARSRARWTLGVVGSAVCACATAIRGARAGNAIGAALRATGGATRDGRDGGRENDDARGTTRASARASDGANAVGVEELDENARESETAAAIRSGARVRLTDARAREMLSGTMMAMYGGLGETGETTNSMDVLVGSGSGDYLAWCRRGERASAAPAVASVGAAVHADANKVIFHGGYKVWDAGSEFEDFASTRAFDMKTGEFECLTAGTAENEKAALGQTHGACPKLHGAHTGKRDEEVAVITTKPIRLPKAVAKKETAHVEAALGKHLTRPELPAIDVEDEEDDATTSSVEETTDGEGASELGSESKQHAMIIFGGRDENDQRLGTVYALGLEDKKWRKIEYELPDERDDMVPQGPFEMPLIVKNEHKNGKPFPLGRSGATAVVTKDNKMIIYGGFVVEGRLGFNVGETLVLDLDKMKFSYPMTSGSIPVRRNKHSAVLDNENRMWVWGGSVWDHTGGSSTYASTATYYADVSNPKSIVWHRVETKGKPPSQRRFHSAIIVDGGMYIIGGEDYRTRTYLNDVHRLDLKTFTWTQPAVLGGLEGGRIRSSMFPWVTDAFKKLAHPEASLGKSHHEHTHDDKHEEDLKRKVSIKDADEEKPKDEKKDETNAFSIDISTCGKGEQARVRTGENQPEIENLISVLVDGSTLASKNGALGAEDPTDAASLAASLASNGWLANTARGASIMSESSMVWRKAPSVGESEGVPGWITDAGGRDSSILTETLDADPDAASIEERLLAAIKSVSSDTKLKSSGGSAHAVKKSETKEHEKASPKKRVDSEDEDDEKKTKKSSHHESSPHHKSSRDHDDEDEDAEEPKSLKSSHHKSSKEANHEDDDEESEHKTHHGSRHKDEDEDESRHSSHSHSASHKKEKVHLSGAAKMLQMIQSQGADEARLGRVANIRAGDSARHFYLWSGVALVAIAAAILINQKKTEKKQESDVERIPLVLSSSSISDSPNKSATWQQEALARRGVRYGDDFDEP